MRSSNFMNYYDLCKIQRNSTINNAIHLVRTSWRSISCAWFEKIWSFHERVTERIWSRTILVQRKGHTNQRPLSFERRSLIVEGYYIDAICSEGVNWNAVVTQEMQPWDSLTRLSQLCVSEKKQVGHDLIVIYRIHERWIVSGTPSGWWNWTCLQKLTWT